MKIFMYPHLILNFVAANAKSVRATYTGRVTAQGEALEFATVGLLKTSFTATTTQQGEFELKNVPDGKYQLRISALSYEYFQTEVVLADNQTVTLNVDLIPLASKMKEIVV